MLLPHLGFVAVSPAVTGPATASDPAARTQPQTVPPPHLIVRKHFYFSFTLFFWNLAATRLALSLRVRGHPIKSRLPWNSGQASQRSKPPGRYVIYRGRGAALAWPIPPAATRSSRHPRALLLRQRSLPTSPTIYPSSPPIHQYTCSIHLSVPPMEHVNADILLLV